MFSQKSFFIAGISSLLVVACGSRDSTPITRGPQNSKANPVAGAPHLNVVQSGNKATPGSTYLGSGFDYFSQSNSNKNICISGDFSDKLTINQLQDMSLLPVKIQEVSSIAEVKEFLKIAPANVWLWGLEGVNPFEPLLEKIAVNKNSFSAIFEFSVVDHEGWVTEPHLTVEAASLLKNQGPKAFFEQCGSHFVKSFEVGAKSVIYVKISTPDYKPKQDFAQAIRNDLQQIRNAKEAKEFLKKSSTAYTVTLATASTADVIPSEMANLDQAFNQLNVLPLLAKQSPQTLVLGTQEYPQLKEKDQYSKPEQRNAILFDLHKQLDALTDSENTLADVKLRYEKEIAATDLTGINEDLKAIQEQKNSLEDLRKKCQESPVSCNASQEKISVSRFELPSTTSRNEVCGAEVYHNGTSAEICGTHGVEVSFDEVIPGVGRGPECGVELYREVTNEQVCGLVDEQRIVGGDNETRWEWVRVPATCRNPAFGVDVYKQCSHARFGHTEKRTRIEQQASSCRSPQFGVELFKVCRHW